MGLPAGRLRHRVTIEALTWAVDADGATVETWADQFGRLLPAEIAPLSGRELIAAAAVQAEVTTRIRIRWRDGIVPSMRVVHRSTTYNIRSVIPDPDSGRRWITLGCTSGVEQVTGPPEVPLAGPHPVGVLTQARAFGAFAGGRYGSFAGR